MIPQVALLLPLITAPVATTLGIDGVRFTVDRKPTFLLGISYYGALGASPEVLKSDLDNMKRLGFNWIRVWAVWSGYDNDVSVVDADGYVREPYLDRLAALLADCNARGMIVDVTFTRGKPQLATAEAYLRAVRAVAERLKTFRNSYFDLANEHDIRDARYVGIDELRTLRDAVKRIDPGRLVTASDGDLDDDGLRRHLVAAGLDFIAPHRARDAGSAERTESITRQCLAVMKQIGHLAPIQYQEPFRRGYGSWQPGAADFLTDATGARSGGAAGWCFHNGGTRTAPDERPRRSFDLRDGTLFSQLDPVERKVVRELAKTLSDAPWGHD